MKNEDELTSEMGRIEWITAEQNMQHDELLDYQLRKIMHEPVGPYVVPALPL